MIVFVDESGFSERPSRVRTWAPRGQTPVIQYHFNWHQLSIIAGLSRWNCYFRLYAGSLDRFRITEFLQALARAIPHKLLLIWDNLPAHRSRLVRDFVDSLENHIHLEFLPAYASELNPVEYLWAWMKKHALANFCPAALENCPPWPPTRCNRSSVARPSSSRAGNKPNCHCKVVR